MSKKLKIEQSAFENFAPYIMPNEFQALHMSATEKKIFRSVPKKVR